MTDSNSTKPSNVSEQSAPAAYQDSAELLRERAHCFLDQHRVPMVFIDGQIYQVRSVDLKAKIFKMVQAEIGEELSSKETKELIFSLEMRSRNGEQIELCNRFARRDNSLLLDLGGSEYVEIEAGNWRVCQKLSLIHI